MGAGGSTYTKLSGFEHVLIEASWLLSVSCDADSAQLELDLVLLPGHSDYVAPKPGEQHCYVGGTISFTGADAVLLEMSGAPPARSADGVLDLDNIDLWDIDADHQQLAGSWGVLDVWGGQVRLAVDFPANYHVELLNGLPGTGPLPITFAEPGQSGSSEGRAIEVHAGTGESWFGNIQPGWSQAPDFVRRTPDPDRFLIVVGGRAWYVDSRQPENSEKLDGWTYGATSLLRQGLLLVEGELFLCAIDQVGVRWVTRTFGPTFGPVTVIEADDDSVTVELLDSDTDRPRRARLRLNDGGIL